MFLKDRLFGNDIKIHGFSDVTAGTVMCLLNDLAKIVAGVTANPATSMGAIGTGVQLDIASSNAGDTGTIQVYGEGPNFVPMVRIITLTGTTVVTTPATDKWLRVFAATPLSAALLGNVDIAVTGTGAFTAGSITTPATGGILRIAIGIGSGYSGYWTVPALVPGVAGGILLPGGQQGKKAKLQGLTLGIATQNARFLIQVQPNLETVAPLDALLGTVWEIEMSGTAGGPGWVDLARHVEDFSPGTDILMKIVPGTAAAIVSAVLDLKMVGV